MTDRGQQDREAFEKWYYIPVEGLFNRDEEGEYLHSDCWSRFMAWQAALAYERGKSGEDDDQMTDGWLRSIGGVEPDYTEDFAETTFIFDLDNDHCLNLVAPNIRNPYPSHDIRKIVSESNMKDLSQDDRSIP